MNLYIWNTPLGIVLAQAPDTEEAYDLVKRVNYEAYLHINSANLDPEVRPTGQRFALTALNDQPTLELREVAQ